MVLSHCQNLLLANISSYSVYPFKPLHSRVPHVSFMFVVIKFLAFCTIVPNYIFDILTYVGNLGSFIQIQFN